MTRHYWQTADGGEYDSMTLCGESDNGSHDSGSMWVHAIDAGTAADWQSKIDSLEERIVQTEILIDRYCEWMRKTSKPVSFAVWRVRFESLLSLVQEVRK